MDENLDEWRQAGKIASQAREYGRKLIQTGASMLEVANNVEAKIKELGGQPAFPVNISMNHIAAHDTARVNDDRVFNDEIVKLDVGVHVNGAIGDTACTVDLGDNKDLLQASINALNNAIKVVKPGVQLREIGAEIEAAIKELGFKPVVNLSGHGLGRYQVHTGDSIPNYDNGDKTELEDGDIIAIEPFASTGIGKVMDSSNAEIFLVSTPKPVRSQASRDFYRQTQKFQGMPFCKRWIQMPLFKLNFAIKELSNLGVLKEFPPLPDAGKGLVSQAEHTLLVREKTEVLTN